MNWKPSAYVDTCVLSHLFDTGPAAPSQDMLVALEKIADDPGIDLVTSAKTLDEIARDPDRVRRVNSKLLFRLLTKVEPGPTMYPRAADVWRDDVRRTDHGGRSSDRRVAEDLSRYG